VVDIIETRKEQLPSMISSSVWRKVFLLFAQNFHVQICEKKLRVAYSAHIGSCISFAENRKNATINSMSTVWDWGKTTEMFFELNSFSHRVFCETCNRSARTSITEFRVIQKYSF
jgi:hypothetical protein